jgi:hypothetical protein
MRGMYTETILKLIAERPGIRAVEIADKIDCEVEAVERSISEQIESGYVRREIIKAPNGRPTPAFWMKDAPPIAPAPAPIAPPAPKVAPPAPVAAPAVEAPVEPPAPADEPAIPALEAPPAPVAERPIPSAAAVAPAARTKVEILMDYLRNKPGLTATDDEFRKLIGLRKDQHPSTFLSTQRRKGEIHKDIGVWRLGPRRAVADHPAAKPEQIAEQPEAAEFRCALWSDGELQLARGKQIAMWLTATEARQLFDYLRLAA